MRDDVALDVADPVLRLESRSCILLSAAELLSSSLLLAVPARVHGLSRPPPSTTLNGFGLLGVWLCVCGWVELLPLSLSFSLSSTTTLRPPPSPPPPLRDGPRRCFGCQISTSSRKYLTPIPSPNGLSEVPSTIFSSMLVMRATVHSRLFSVSLCDGVGLRK